MKESRFERIKREKQKLEQANKEKNDDEPKNPYKWVENDPPKNELTNNRTFRILYKRVLDDCPF